MKLTIELTSKQYAKLIELAKERKTPLGETAHGLLCGAIEAAKSKPIKRNRYPKG